MLLLGLLLLFLFPLLVALPADYCRDRWFLSGFKPSGILGDALALRFPVDIECATMSGRVRPHDGRLRGFQLRVGRIRLEAHLAGEAAQSVMEWIEFLY